MWIWAKKDEHVDLCTTEKKQAKSLIECATNKYPVYRIPFRKPTNLAPSVRKAIQDQFELFGLKYHMVIVYDQSGYSQHWVYTSCLAQVINSNGYDVVVMVKS